MRNLWIFVSRYNAFFFFVIFFSLGIILCIKNNAYQRSISINSTNAIVGTAYERLNVIKRYLYLGRINDSLALENATLRAQLINIANADSTQIVKVTDTVYNQQYTLLSAKVIKNSVNQRNNYITINKGSNEGLARDMAVISPQRGIVGFIVDVSPKFATIRSLLNKETLVSVIVKKNGAFGSLVWGDGNYDLRKAYVKEIPNHYKINLRDTIVTSGAGGFPKGILVGRVSKTQIITGDNFKTLEVDLFNDLGTLQYVYIIKDRLAIEQKLLEQQLPDEQ
ncbi:MAG: rod shape-determining protein MreC [Pedobacter sp.]|nr:MAG: rod shape-determining protein MreC [Pedobacter sp.]